jgi:hypothetical protein
MSKRAHEDEPSLSRTRHRAGSPSRAGTNDTSAAPFLPSELVSQSIGTFLDSPFDTLSRRVQQDRLAAAFRDVEVVSPTAAAHGAEEGRAFLIRHALPDMTTADMRRFVTSSVIRALTRLVSGIRGNWYISILPLSQYTEDTPEDSIDDVAFNNKHVEIAVDSGGWRIHRPLNDDDYTLPDPDLTEARLARFIPFIYPPPHDRKEDGELAGLEYEDIGLDEQAELNGVPDEGLADAIALFCGHIILPEHVVLASSVHEMYAYDVHTDDWHILDEELAVLRPDEDDVESDEDDDIVGF